MWCPQCGGYWTPSPVVHECPCQTERRRKESANAINELLKKKGKAAEEFKNKFLTIVNDYHDLSVKQIDKNESALKAWGEKCKLWLDVDLFQNFSVTDTVGGAGFSSIEKINLLQQNDIPKFMASYISENVFARFDNFHNSCNQKLDGWLARPNELCCLDDNIWNVRNSIEFLNALNSKIFSANAIKHHKNELLRILKTLESKKESLNNAEQAAIAENNFRVSQESHFIMRIELIRKMFIAWLIFSGPFFLLYWATESAHIKEKLQNPIHYYHYLLLWPFMVLKWIPLREMLAKYISEDGHKMLLQLLYYGLSSGLLVFLYYLKYKTYRKSVWVLKKLAPWIYALILYPPLLYSLYVIFCK